MDITRMREFQRFACSLNFTQASIELNLSQSNLSKHIRSIELELGCDLIDRGTRISLTPAGNHFLSRTSHILNIYDSLLEECKVIKNSKAELVFQDPHIVDEATEAFCQMAEDFHQHAPSVPIRFSRIRKNSLENTLIKHGMDVALAYDGGDIQSVIQKYESNGFFAKYLASEQAIIWCDNDSELAEKSLLTVSDLKGVPVMAQSREYDPCREALLTTCADYGFKPDLCFCQADIFIDFLYAEGHGGVYFLPESYASDRRLKIKRNRSFLRFKDGDVKIHVFAVMCQPENESQKLFYDFLFGHSSK